jgi:hypothetical protein
MPKLTPPNDPQPVRPGTLVETDEDIRRSELANKAAMPLAPPGAKKADAVPTSKPTAPAPFRPTLRPPICVLTVFDDGKSEGEVIRIRGSRFVIGRSEGDLLIPHDEQISSRHIEISRQLVGGVQRWVVTDLQSTNGLFLRVSRTVLADKAEFLVGKGRFRFEQAGSQAADTVDHLVSTPIPAGTVGFGDQAPAGLHPALVELIAGGIGNRILMTQAEYWIGTDASCAICRVQDPFTEPKHVRLFRDPKGAWTAQNNKSLNGLWIKVPQMTAEDGCLLQIGEQRIRLKVGG